MWTAEIRPEYIVGTKADKPDEFALHFKQQFARPERRSVMIAFHNLIPSGFFDIFGYIHQFLKVGNIPTGDCIMEYFELLARPESPCSGCSRGHFKPLGVVCRRY